MRLLKNHPRASISPLRLSSGGVFVAAMLAMAVLSAIDLEDGSQIWLSPLYSIPIGAGAYFCGRKGQLGCIMLSSVAFQAAVIHTYHFSHATEFTNLLIAILSTAAVAYFARTSRIGYLAIETLASTDKLTGLSNRGAFEAIAEREIARQRRYGEIFSLAYFDLDGFKLLNDTHGHMAGDLALKNLADVLRQSTRESDTAARMGGDEFAILMPNTVSEDCLLTCRKLSAEITSQMLDRGLDITASFGCFTFDEPPSSISEALHLVDLAMYKAKAAGDGSIVEAIRRTTSAHQAN